jgi:hypothetical protein
MKHICVQLHAHVSIPPLDADVGEVPVESKAELIEWRGSAVDERRQQSGGFWFLWCRFLVGPMDGAWQQSCVIP